MNATLMFRSINDIALPNCKAIATVPIFLIYLPLINTAIARFNGKVDVRSPGVIVWNCFAQGRVDNGNIANPTAALAPAECRG